MLYVTYYLHFMPRVHVILAYIVVSIIDAGPKVGRHFGPKRDTFDMNKRRAKIG
jgi:hypothetical protein